MSRPREIGCDSLSGSERQILDLFDIGFGPDHIIARTGYSRSKVLHVISSLGGGPCHKMKDDFIDGSQMMIDRLQAVHPERFA